MKTIKYLMLICLMFGITLIPMVAAASGAPAGKKVITPEEGIAALEATPYEKKFGAPIMPGGKIVKTEDTAAFYEISQPHEKVVEFYKEVLKVYGDEKFRDWKDQIYIEDLGGAKWHSIGIMKGDGEKTTVKITRDNMTWVFSTLIIRFAGVFFVLCVLWVLLNLNSFCMKKFFPDTKKAAAK
ncbi:MAG: hypothetical protein C0392_01270 [Syntrophus sp. (in: bacteria)]|nr:hypothetical protein [Syntrophus sp. (in: bacteria)]